MGFKYFVNSNFFRNWNQRMAYTLGFIYADGNLLNDRLSRGKYVSVTNIDFWLVNSIKTWLDAEHKIKRISPSGNNRTKYILKIGDADIYESLINLGLYPNKSSTVRMPKIPDKFLADFVRGYFDGDGCVYLYRSKGKRQKTILRSLSVIFTSGSKKFLEDLLIKLKEKIGLKQSKVYNSHRSFQLRLTTGDSVEIFKFLYKNTNQVFLKRKFDIFCKYFTLRPERIDNRVKKILV
ncbi:MAG TPA: LAGLIDADG family homing endonuclease [Candidatus Paceibacterota bacterium]|nr:LAGLIDADG family homing endonuclease [Candidatus Paceibacterota bacterium]